MGAAGPHDTLRDGRAARLPLLRGPKGHLSNLTSKHFRIKQSLIGARIKQSLIGCGCIVGVR